MGARRTAGILLGTLLAAALATAGGVPARGLEKDDVQIRGFGGWAYGVTDGNQYLIGDEDGVFDNVQLSLNLTVEMHERFTIVTQVEFEQEDDDVDTELDFAFVEIKLNNALNLRLGRVKHPFGLYAEVFDVGTIRPFFLLPQSIYGPQGITAEHYDGAGLRGSHHGDAWGVEWNLYVGEFEGELEFPGPLTGDPALIFEPQVLVPFEVNDVVGGRVNIFPPVEGLMFGVSAFEGSQVFADIAGSSIDASYLVYGVHAEYLADDWSVRAEAATFELEGGDFVEADGVYVEVARRLGEHWQVAARYDDFDLSFGPRAPVDLSMLPPFALQFTQNRDLGLAVNYWLSPQLVIRLNFHRAEGSRFAFPGNVADAQRAFMTGRLDDDTDLIVFGAQFSF